MLLGQREQHELQVSGGGKVDREQRDPRITIKLPHTRPSAYALRDDGPGPIRTLLKGATREIQPVRAPQIVLKHAAAACDRDSQESGRYWEATVAVEGARTKVFRHPPSGPRRDHPVARRRRRAHHRALVVASTAVARGSRTRAPRRRRRCGPTARIRLKPVGSDSKPGLHRVVTGKFRPIRAPGAGSAWSRRACRRYPAPLPVTPVRRTSHPARAVGLGQGAFGGAAHPRTAAARRPRACCGRARAHRGQPGDRRREPGGTCGCRRDRAGAHHVPDDDAGLRNGREPRRRRMSLGPFPSRASTSRTPPGPRRRSTRRTRAPRTPSTRATATGSASTSSIRSTAATTSPATRTSARRSCRPRASWSTRVTSSG